MSGQARGHLAMLLFSALVAGSFSLGVMAAPHIDPAALTALRFWLAAAIVGTAAALTTGLPRRALQAPWRYLLLGGMFGIYFVLMFEGLKTAQAVSASAVFTLTPVIAGIAGWFLLRQITTPRMALALAIGAVGAVWVIFRADLAALARFQIGRGEAIFFVGCIAHAVYTPMVRKLNRGEPPVVFTFGMLIGGGLLVTAWAWPAIRATDWMALPGIVWITLAYVSIFASATTFVLLQYATMHLPSAKVMAYTYLTPSWVILLEFALGNGLPSAWVLGGVALTILALLLLLRDDAPAPAPTPQSP
ncbi:MAG: DMT family transporter [Paracoccaceae bacterium]|jgi:drug/metabolite transporter (DMT)-like permease|uniref:DMT family transporter n=1 Tax=unclassified Seohaeicola TaxID=2641111 RepID=UPI00237BE263|nr:MULTISPECIES: DMT family transporter [unclassified Seohaeicola]MDD9708900.1 DMT family transporter [Seohaeicola sp. 4SK31]MDD9736986.1 DMT family transporter [Seohaeicola sp. SP36]MDM7970364.1 DMT family transporter [Paracoccaceae bacterium]